MILTVTPNTAIDRTLFVPTFRLGRTLRASRAAMGMGGKAADAAWILGEMGYDVLATGFASGLAGFQMEEMLRERGVETDFIWVKGETRTNTIIVAEDVGSQTTVSVPSLIVDGEFLDVLFERYQEYLGGSSCVIIGGSLPNGVRLDFHFQYIEAARRRDIPVIFDSSGAALRHGLEASPTFVKPNRDELGDLAGTPIDSLDEAYLQGCALREAYGTFPVITLGGEGALAVLSDRTYHIPAPSVEVASTAGAGDAILAGLAAAIDSGEPIEEGLRLGFAAAAAVMLTPATADCDRAEVERLRPAIELRPYPK
jgi:1-phosphofructokinase family hexose kinase